jgi:class 3 adenylate cyclase
VETREISIGRVVSLAGHKLNRRGVTLSSTAVAAGAFTLVSVLSVAASALSATNGRPPDVYLPVGISGVIYAGSAAVMYVQRPGSAASLALFLSAFNTAVLVVMRYVFPILMPINEAFGLQAGLLPLTYLFLSFPFDRLAGRLERLTFWASVALGLVLGVARLLSLEPMLAFDPATCAPCTHNPFLIIDPALFDEIQTASLMSFVILLALTTVVIVRRWLRSSGLTRRALTVLFPGWLSLALSNALLLAVLPTFRLATVSSTLALLFRIAVPIALAFAFVRFYTARSAMARSLIRLQPGTSLQSIEQVMRTTMAEPDLEVTRWSPLANAYLDDAGRKLDPSAIADDKASLFVERDGEPLALVIHDRAMASDREILEIIADTVRHTTEIAALHDELVARGGDVTRLPRGEVSFLFGDLEGSTRLLNRLGETYKDILETVRSVVRRSATSAGGEVVDIRADDCFLAFQHAPSALAAALDIQHELGSTKLPDDLELRMRIGLHTGSPELTQSGYVGLDLHRAARIMAMSKGGQILASGAFISSLGDQRPAGVRLRALGSFELRGLDEEEQIFEVATSG